MVKLIGVETLFRSLGVCWRTGRGVLGVEAWGWVWGVGCLGMCGMECCGAQGVSFATCICHKQT